MNRPEEPSFRAKLHGEPIAQIPSDLFIPPDALEVFLDSFEGPLDLLLYLIRKQGFDILDIPMIQVTEQYLKYVQEIKDHNLELAADYLVMAAVMIEIKSRLLLPKLPISNESEIEDPRAELAQRLLEYEKIKKIATQLNDQPIADRDFYFIQLPVPPMVHSPPQVTLNELLANWLIVLKRNKQNQKHVITRESLSVSAFMTQILKTLQQRPFIEFNETLRINQLNPITTQSMVVTFIALLELCRNSLVQLTQVEPYAPLFIRLNYEIQSEIEILSITESYNENS